MRNFKLPWKALLLGLIGGISVISLILWRLHVSAQPALSQSCAILLDTSGSNSQNPCECAQAITQRALSQRRDSQATLSLLRIGDDHSALEPILLAEYPIPMTRQALERSQTLTARREQLTRNLHQQCQALQPTNRSPIFKAVMGSLAHLRAKGCAPSSDCTLYVRSDLDELTEPHIRAALQATSPMTKTKLPDALNNSGIHVVFLGTANLAGSPRNSQNALPSGRTPEQTRRLEEVWRSLFTQPELVAFEPFCSAPAISSAPTR